MGWNFGHYLQLPSISKLNTICQFSERYPNGTLGSHCVPIDSSFRHCCSFSWFSWFSSFQLTLLFQQMANKPVNLCWVFLKLISSHLIIKIYIHPYLYIRVHGPPFFGLRSPFSVLRSPFSPCSVRAIYSWLND